MADDDVVLITGASVGLGEALARRLIERTRYRVILTAREASLERFRERGVEEGDRVWLRALDVRDADQRRAVIDEADERWDGVDVLVNNAGFSFRSVVEHVTEEERLLQMDVNFRSPMELIRLVLPAMRRKRRGRILNISSVGGMMSMPTMAVYSASKFALEGATEALWYEVRPWNVHVSLVEPGFISSSSFERVRHTELSQAARDGSEDAYHAHYEHMAPFIRRMMKRSPSTRDSVARVIHRTMRRRHPPLRVPATFDAWLFTMLRRLLPRRLYHALLYRMLPGVSSWGPGSS